MALAFGLWGALAGEISFAATVVAALTYGIVVDDTVHVLARFRRLRKAGVDAIEAVRDTYATVGLAIVVTSLALAISFLPFALSGFLVNRHFG
ncbi:MAG: MMPL family transporter, partial [Myxococcota bacterium]